MLCLMNHLKYTKLLLYLLTDIEVLILFIYFLVQYEIQSCTPRK